MSDVTMILITALSPAFGISFALLLCLHLDNRAPWSKPKTVSVVSYMEWREAEHKKTDFAILTITRQHKKSPVFEIVVSENADIVL